MMYGLYTNNFGWGAENMMGWFGGGIMMIVFWALVIALIVWIVREVSGGNSVRSRSNALDILKERYAKGEIDKEEFEAKKKDIN
jgi:putative membrane protein